MSTRIQNHKFNRDEILYYAKKTKIKHSIEYRLQNSSDFTTQYVLFHTFYSIQRTHNLLYLFWNNKTKNHVKNASTVILLDFYALSSVIGGVDIKTETAIYLILLQIL